MDSLKMVYTKDCRPWVAELLAVHKSLTPLPELKVPAGELKGGNLRLFHAVDVTKLEIFGLGEVKSFEEAQSIKLAGKQGIENLKFTWSTSSYNDSKVLGGLEPPSTIESLKIYGYNDMIFPDWLMGISHNNFPNLVRMCLKDLANCINLPPLGQLPNLQTLVLQNLPSVAKIDEDFCGGTVAFPRLESFTLSFMENLEVWNTRYSCGGGGVSGYMFPSLRKLEIEACPKLRLKPCLPKAEKWSINGSDSVISSWGESTLDEGASTSSSPLVTILRIEDCNLPMHQWRLLHHLPALPYLCIEKCSDLTSSPEIIGALTSLRGLSMWMADGSQRKLPEWLGHLTSLEELIVQGYFKVDAVQDKAKLPSSLQSLELGGYESMAALQLWVEEIMSLKRLKISRCHNQNNLQEIMGSLTSLQELEIEDCSNIKSLPESIQQLTNLEKLKITGCPALQRWCETEENKKKLAHIKEKIGFD